MATKSSGSLAPSASYTLGEYVFRIERKSISGSTNDQVDAIGRKDGKNARKSIQIPSSATIKNWYVEANGTTADVYIEVEGVDVPPFPFGTIASATGDHDHHTNTYEAPGVTIIWPGGNSAQYFFASPEPGAQAKITDTWYTPPKVVYYDINTPYTYMGKTVYYYIRNSTWITIDSASPSTPRIDPSAGLMAWSMFYSADDMNMLVGRFPIELEDAGGVGPGSDWDDPGDYDDDRDPEDPTTTLYLTVEGALSGRHNDPLNNTSYSYIPSDKATVKECGCGGDGGNGGGGGAGAANVVVFKFATNEADHKDITTIAKRHGYGSGGGKGGKGGDGCVLIYY